MKPASVLELELVNGSIAISKVSGLTSVPKQVARVNGSELDPKNQRLKNKEKIAPLFNTRKPVVEAVKLGIGYLAAPQTEFAEM
jgi:hypothetical protein